MKTLLNIRKSPHGLLLFTSIALLFALTLRPIANIDFQGRTMFGLPSESMGWIIPLFLLLFWLLYLLTKNFLYSITISRAHVLITVISALLFFVAVLYIGISPSQYIRDRHELAGNAMQILTMIFIFGQLIYVANVLLGLFYKKQIN
ncbi:MAG: hypothetical protein SFU87_15005 [Chitinophagaceae bacterium]|nr:hypothetical protein [Chitinophagaceae bacterium]